jgi:Mce-associated membrane protein
MTEAMSKVTQTPSTEPTEGEEALAADSTASIDGPEHHVAEIDIRSEDDSPRGRFSVARVLAFAILPGVALLLALTAGYLKWIDSTVRDADLARSQSVRAATDSTVALLSYRPDTAEKNLVAARDRLTGPFRDSYTSLTKDVVIPGAKEKQISAVATVPAAASVSASETHAVVLVFVNQTTIISNGAPTDSASAVRITLDKVDDRWLISQFDPI